MRPLYEVLARNLDSHTIVVAQGQTFGARLAHDKHRVPLVTIHLQPATFEASSEIRRRALLITQYPDQLPPLLPDGVAAFAHVPFPAVLPHCAALVHHGGIGTAAQALAAGIPQLVRPAAFDQPDNAVRLQRIGVGWSIRPSAFTSRVVAHRLHMLLESADVAAKCRAYAALIHPAAGLARACEAIEEVMKPLDLA